MALFQPSGIFGIRLRVNLSNFKSKNPSVREKIEKLPSIALTTHADFKKNIQSIYRTRGAEPCSRSYFFFICVFSLPELDQPI
jgi:hypothetical protein